jgi:hypothetical protein
MYCKGALQVLHKKGFSEVKCAACTAKERVHGSLLCTTMPSLPPGHLLHYFECVYVLQAHDKQGSCVIIPCSLCGVRLHWMLSA